MMERSTAKVSCGFAFQLLLYTLYILTGVALVALAFPSAADGGPSQVCVVNVKVYACVGVLAALRAVVQLCISFHKYLRKQSTFPSARELWVRVAIKVLVTAYGLALFGAFYREGQLLALRRAAYSLWVFFGVTLWSNFISVCCVPFNFKESLHTARRIQEEQEAEAGTRPLSTQHSQSKYDNYAQRTISSGYHVESPEDFRRAGTASGYHSEHEGDDSYAAAAPIA